METRRAVRGFVLATLLVGLAAIIPACQAGSQVKAGFPNYQWEPVGLSGGGGMFAPGISPVDRNLMMVNCDMSGAYITTDGGRHWTLIHQRQLRSSTWCRPGFHPKEANTIYACDGETGRLKKSTDRGVQWSFVGDFRPYGVIALDPDSPSLMLAGSDDGLSLSRDAGETWSKCEGPTGRVVGFFFDRTSPQEARRLFAATDKGLWRSDDGGGAWEQKQSGLPSPEITSFAGGANPKTGLVMLYCSVPSVIRNGQFTGGVFRSRDRGDNWESAMQGGINTETTKFDEWADGDIAQYPFVLTTDTKPLTVYAFNTSTGFYPPRNPGVYRSDDGGDIWRQTMYMDPRFKGQFNRQHDYFTTAQGRSDQSGAFGAAIAQSDPEVVMHLGGICFITHDGGKTWEAAHTILAPGQKEVPGCAWLCNGLVVTTTWHHYTDPFQPNRHYIAYTDIGFARSLDAGKSWIWWPQEKWPPWSNTCYELAFDPQVPGKMWGAFSNTHDIPNYNIIGGSHRANLPGGVCLSTDFGETWKVVRSGDPSSACTTVVLDPKSRQGARTLYAGFFDDGVYKSTDDGKTWVKKSRGLGAPENMRVYRLILHPDGTLFALITAKREGGKFLKNGAGLYRSRDSGESWECISESVGFRWPKDFAVDPGSSKIIFIGVANGGEEQSGLWRTADGGATWKRVSRQGQEHFGAYFHPQRKGWIYMTLTEGPPGPSLWLSMDNGNTWRSLDSFPFANAQRVEFDPKDPNTICVTTFGASVWKGKAR
jgi:photosystem II stability/assembly factor-like uncharacterized protein